MLSDVEERQQTIVNHLKINQFARITELIDLVNYSEATVKRDLVVLEQSGLIRRVRGGAMLVDNQKIDVPYMMKITHLEEESEKRYIADIAANLIKDDMVLFLDSSTTSLHLVRNLGRFEGLQIITNGVITAAMLLIRKTNKSGCSHKIHSLITPIICIKKAIVCSCTPFLVSAIINCGR